MPQRPAYGPGAGGGYRPVERPPSSPMAVAGIVSGVTAIVVLVLSLGTSFALGLVAGLLALFCAHSARRRMDAGTPGREGQVRAARTLGLVGVGLSVAAMVTWLVIYLATGYGAQDLLDDLQRWSERQLSR